MNVKTLLSASLFLIILIGCKQEFSEKHNDREINSDQSVVQVKFEENGYLVTN